MDVDRSSLRMIRQVHGVHVAVVRAGSGAGWTAPEADVIVSDDPDSAIVVRVADCAPILFADTRLGVVAAAHAGWRGAAQGVAPAAVNALREHFGSQPRDLIAAIGPCLGVCCGEVGPEVVEAFASAGHSRADIERWFRPGEGDRFYLDLAGASAGQLAAAGVPPDHIHVSGLCTKSYPQLFHSYRAHGREAGRLAAVIQKEELISLLPSSFILRPFFPLRPSRHSRGDRLPCCAPAARARRSPDRVPSSIAWPARPAAASRDA